MEYDNTGTLFNMITRIH